MNKENNLLMVYNRVSGQHRAEDAVESVMSSCPELGLVAVSIASLNKTPSLIMQFPHALILGGDGTHFSVAAIVAGEQAKNPGSSSPILGFLNFGCTGVAANRLGLVRRPNESDSDFLKRTVNSTSEGDFETVSLMPGRVFFNEENRNFFWNTCFGQVFTGALLGVDKHRDQRQRPILRKAMGLVEVIKNYDPKNPPISIHSNGQEKSAIDAGVISPAFGLWPQGLFGYPPGYALYLVSGGDRYQTAAKLLIDMAWGVLTNKDLSFRKRSLSGAVSQIVVNENQIITMTTTGNSPLSIDSEPYCNGTPIHKVEVSPLNVNGKPVTVFRSKDR